MHAHGTASSTHSLDAGCCVLRACVVSTCSMITHEWGGKEIAITREEHRPRVQTETSAVFVSRRHVCNRAAVLPAGRPFALMPKDGTQKIAFILISESTTGVCREAVVKRVE